MLTKIKTPTLYITVILTWGLSWYTVKIQTKFLSPESLVGYRFLLAFGLLFCLLKSQNKLTTLSTKQHSYCFFLGATLFAFNYYTFYQAAVHMTSALMAVIFASAPIFNSINAYLWFRKKATLKTITGCLLGLVGIVILFYPDIKKDFATANLWQSIVLCVMGTIFFSTGNMLSIKMNSQSSDLPSTTCWAMAYGGSMMLGLSFFTSRSLPAWSLFMDMSFIASMLYLILFASIVAFLSYLELVNRLGSDKAAYTIIMVPIVAILVSIGLEGYAWTIQLTTGIVLISVGNLMVFKE